MFEEIVEKMKQKIISGIYIMSLHAEEEMEEDQLTIFDVESGILNGKILQRQKDIQTGEWKYLIRGHDLSNETIYIVAKLSLTLKLFIITVYSE